MPSKLSSIDQSLMNSYDDTWAVITGGSDGIGLGFAQELAKSGFNICIISRNESKINEKLSELKLEFPNIQTKCVVVDFGKVTSI